MLQTKFLVTPDIYDDSNGKVLEDYDGVWRLAIIQNTEV